MRCEGKVQKETGNGWSDPGADGVVRERMEGTGSEWKEPGMARKNDAAGVTAGNLGGFDL